MTALVASTVWLVVSKVRDERADRRDVRAMAFSSNVLPDNGTIQPPDTVRLELLNKGPDHVRVLDVRVDAPGYATIRVDDTVGRNGGLIVMMPTTTTACSDSLYTHGPRALIVRARTARGTGVTVRAPLADEFEGQLWSAARLRCGIVLIDEALTTELTDIAWGGGTVTATFALANSARIPLTIDTVTAFDGLALKLQHLPLTLPAARAGDRPGRGRIVLHLRVVSCADMRERFNAAGGGREVEFPALLTATFHHRYGHGQTDLYLDVPPDRGTRVHELAYLLEWCDQRNR